MKRILTLLIFVAFLVPAMAFAADGPYEVLEKDGGYIVSKDGGESQTGYYGTKEAAESAAHRANKKWNSIQKSKEKTAGDE